MKETNEKVIKSTPMKKGRGGQHFFQGELSESGHSRDRPSSTHVLRSELGSVNICRDC